MSNKNYNPAVPSGAEPRLARLPKRQGEQPTEASSVEGEPHLSGAPKGNMPVCGDPLKRKRPDVEVPPSGGSYTAAASPPAMVATATAESYYRDDSPDTIDIPNELLTRDSPGPPSAAHAQTQAQQSIKRPRMAPQLPPMAADSTRPAPSAPPPPPPPPLPSYYQPSYQTSYQPSYQTSYQPGYQPGYQPSAQPDFGVRPEPFFTNRPPPTRAPPAPANYAGNALPGSECALPWPSPLPASLKFGHGCVPAQPAAQGFHPATGPQAQAQPSSFNVAPRINVPASGQLQQGYPATYCESYPRQEHVHAPGFYSLCNGHYHASAAGQAAMAPVQPQQPAMNAYHASNAVNEAYNYQTAVARTAPVVQAPRPQLTLNITGIMVIYLD